MATVVISDRLVQGVSRRVQDLYKAKIEAANETPKARWGAMFYEAAMPQDIRDKLAALPNEYSKWSSSAQLYFNSYGWVECEFATNLRFPMAFNVGVNGCTTNNSYNSSMRANINTTDPRWETLKNEVALRHENKKNCEAERDTAVYQAVKVLRTFRTLAPAIKAWPSLYGLLDDDTKTKHLEVVKRNTTKREIPHDLDLSDLSSRIIAKRITGV